MSHPPYPAYKDSGVAWLGEVPEHWNVKQLKYVSRFNYGDALAAEVRDETGSVPVYGSNGVVGTHASANTRCPAIIIGRKGSYGKVSYSYASAFCIDTAYFIDQTCTRNNLRWLFYALQPLDLDQLSQDTGVPGLSRDKAYATQLAEPPIEEQAAIAVFLDRETATIAALIAKQQRLIALLQEKRQALIAHAVTKGLNPDAPLQDSGVEWLGEIPAHWERKRLRFIADLNPSKQEAGSGSI